jgi:hypothetical protein
MKFLQFLVRRRSPKPHPQDLSQVNLEHPLYKTYQALSTAPVETLWQTLINLADMATWHPLINSTNAPRGLTVKPGLIYRVIPRWLPIPIHIFVERVSPLVSLVFRHLDGRSIKRYAAMLDQLSGLRQGGDTSPPAAPLLSPSGRLRQHKERLRHELYQASNPNWTGAFWFLSLRRRG